MLGGGSLMHVTASPLLVELPVGEPAQIAVTITNTTALIDAYRCARSGSTRSG